MIMSEIKLTGPQLRELQWAGKPTSQLVRPIGNEKRVHDALVEKGLERYVGAGCYEITEAGRDHLKALEGRITAMNTILTGKDRRIYGSLIRVYRVCYFASKRGNREITRECAAIIKSIRLDHPKVFARFKEWHTDRKRDLKARQN
jgi:hypothetical protein